MPLGPVLRSVLGSALSPTLGEGVGGLTDAQRFFNMFANGEGGDWWSAAALDTMFQTYLGVTNVSADADRVGLWGGKARFNGKTLTEMQALATDIVTWDIPDVALNTSTGDWRTSASVSYVAATGVVTAGATGYLFYSRDIAITAGWHEFSFSAKLGTLTGPSLSVRNMTAGADIIAATSYASQINGSTYSTVKVKFFAASAINVRLYLLRDSTGTNGTNVLIDPTSVSLKRIDSVFAVQASANLRGTYDNEAAWPQMLFDGVDDVLVPNFPASLGSDCTVAYVDISGAVTMLTAQTIGTTYNINVNGLRELLIIDRALTPEEASFLW